MAAHGGAGFEYGTSDGKPCRACTDFRTWAKLAAKGPAKGNVSSEKEQQHKPRKNCPLDKDKLGRHTWSFLHTMAAYYPESPSSEQKKNMKQFFSIFSQFYPCEHCAEDLRNQLKVTPPETQSQEDLSQWLCRIHNNINLRLGKPEFDCSKVNERWRDGWKDGSCDQ
ncbi:FAD-linked sulfhydryl oxidase ALR [Anabrus simplex]|uniref:FAD-linked sulfhydryl oxidase ALR n=1 Tax=Anabrus simplex TaxID=316456 RepID=UPI0034DCEA12